jgi:glycosyltransferase involved in cell wall biosynthesis
MPTRDRRRFVPQAIAYFLRQDYPNRELLVLDDGADPVEDLVPADERIRYVRIDVLASSLGAKRNRAVELSRGELIAHWDDDDWMSPSRLGHQVDALVRSGADVCGARVLLHYRLEAGDAWRYDYGQERPPWVAGCTMLYRRSLWSERPFPGLQVGEDSAFLAGLTRDRVQPVDLDADYVALLHPGNTAPKHLGDHRWQRCPLDEVLRCLHGDAAFYAGLRGGRAPTEAPCWARRLRVAAGFGVYHGYGSMAEHLVNGLERAGVRVDVVPLGIDPEGLTDDFTAVWRASQPQAGGPVVFFSWPSGEMARFVSEPELFVYTMWEGSRLPCPWPAQLDHAQAVIVPTRFVARVCRESGVTAPIEVVQQGVDPSAYHFEPRPQRPGLTTLVVATVVPRKHTLEAIAAWKLAFADDPDARLILKARFQYGNYRPDDARITLVDTNEPTRGIAHWYRRADVMLALGSEGFGLPLVEGMATGLPVIALSSEGQGDVCEDAPGLLLPVAPASWEEVNEPPHGPGGVRGVPSVEEVADRLRWVAGHRDEALAMGRAASEWALRHRNVWDMAPGVLDVVEHHLPRPRRLRRGWTMWVPSLDRPCGVAEYARHLAGTLPGVSLVGDPADGGAARLLHVQHEPALGVDDRLAAVAAGARRRGLPVVVTAHCVGPAAAAWEAEVDAVTTTTQHGAALLASRRPRSRVELIRHGCPTWFPPRRRTRGRVIGTFGFLEPHKGFTALMDALDRVPRAELLLFSHARDPEQGRRWDRLAAGRPVRRVDAFLHIEEVACRLAAEADVLAFWYDESATAQASGAVRVGLATGVPVLASPTSWFGDVARVTLQPADLVEGLRRLLEDEPLRADLVAAAREFCEENSWPRVAARHLALWRSLGA